MIQRPTVFILGAGASNSYNFPLGGQLLYRVCAQLRQPGSDQYRCLRDLGFEASLIEDFLDRLRSALPSSVDAFLGDFPEYIPIGKSAIAASLIPHEDHNQLFPPDVSEPANWYRYLMQLLEVSGDGMPPQPLSIVTFNYDRSLEEFAFRAVRAHSRTGRDEKDVRQKLGQLKIIHVHGSLGRHVIEGDGFVPFSPEINPDRVRLGAKAIQIVTEADGESAEFKQAREVIEAAELVVFIGFGYHKQNVERLGLGPAASGWQRSTPRSVIGQRVSIHQVPWIQITEHIFGGKDRVNGDAHDTVRFLQNIIKW